MQTVNPILANALDLLKQGNDELAEKEFAKAATACCEAFGETDIVTARTLAHLARVCATRGKVDMAVPMYRRIVCIHEALPQPSNSDHAVALCELASLLEESGCEEDAAGLLRRKADGIMGELSARMEAAEKDSARSIDDDDDEEEESSEDDGEDGDDGDENSSGSDGGSREVNNGIGGESSKRDRGGSDQNLEQRNIINRK